MLLPETALEVLFVALTVRESGTGGLSSANTAAFYTSVHLWLVKTKHLFFWAVVCKAKGIDTALLRAINKKPLRARELSATPHHQQPGITWPSQRGWLWEKTLQDLPPFLALA